MFLEFAGQSGKDSFHPTQTARLINCFREPLVAGGSIIRPVLAVAPFTSLSATLAQALAVMDGRLFAAASGRLYEVMPDGSFTDAGALVVGCSRTTLAGNNGVMTAVCGGRYFTWDGTTLAEPVAGAFSSFGSVATFGGYTILTERDGSRWQWSAQLDPDDLPGLNFSTADGRDDRLLRAIPVAGQLLLLKERSHEWWYLTGGGGADAFERVAGGVADIGLRDFGLVAKLRDGVFLIGDDGKARVIAPGVSQPVSTPPVETAIRTATPRRVFYYEDEGHMLACIAFADAPAWCFDLSTQEWHERAEGSFLQPWSVADAIQWRGGWYAALDDGTVRRFQRGEADGLLPLVKQATSHTLRTEDGGRPVLRELEVHAPLGFREGVVGLTISRDGGATWSLEKRREIGPVGAYGDRLIWRTLGQSRQVTARVQWTADMAIDARARVRL